MRTYQVDTGYACGGVVVDDNDMVANAAPIFRWMIGKNWHAVVVWKKIKSVVLA